jgi:hypothetical protein
MTAAIAAASLVFGTAARWPNFRPNNSKQAPKICPWPEKIGGRKMAEFDKKWQKRGRKFFYNYLDEKPFNFL